MNNNSLPRPLPGHSLPGKHNYNPAPLLKNKKEIGIIGFVFNTSEIIFYM
jgi:hypothetical protein